MGLGFIFSCKETVSVVAESLHKGLEGLARAGEETSKSLTSSMVIGGGAVAAAAVAISAASAGLAFEAAEHAEKFSAALRQAGVAAHASVAELEGLERVAMRHGLDSLRGSAIGAAEALRELALEGYDASEATAALDSTLTLMKVTGMEAKQAASLVHDSLQQFGLQAGESADLVDSLAFSMRAFGFRSEELGPAMSGLASGAELTHSSLHDVLIAVGLVHSTFPSATRSAQAMNLALQQIANPKVQSELRGIGVATTDVHGRILPLIDILGSLSRATSGMTDAALSHRLETIAGGRAAGGLAAVVDGLRKGVKGANGEILVGGAAIAYLREQMDHTQGTAKKMAELLGDDMGGALKALRNAISNAGVAIGSGFEGPFKHAFQTANLFIRGLTQLFTQGGFTGEIRESLDKNLGLKGFVEGVFIWGSRLINYFRSWGAGFSAAFAPFKPILTDIWNLFGQLGQVLGLTNQSANDNASAWDSLADYGRGVGAVFGALAGAVLPLLRTGIELVGGAVVVLKEAFGSTLPVAKGLYQGLAGVFGLVGGLLSGNWKSMWDGFVDTVVGAAKLVVNIVFSALKMIAQMVDGIGAAFGKDLGVHQFLDRMQTEVNDRVSSGTSVLKSVVSGSDPASSPSAASAALMVKTGSTPVIVHAPASGPPQEVHVHSHVTLDGEKVGEGIAKAKRSSDGRSFHAVAAHGGAF